MIIAEAVSRKAARLMLRGCFAEGVKEISTATTFEQRGTVVERRATGIHQRHCRRLKLARSTQNKTCIEQMGGDQNGDDRVAAGAEEQRKIWEIVALLKPAHRADAQAQAEELTTLRQSDGTGANNHWRDLTRTQSSKTLLPLRYAKIKSASRRSPLGSELSRRTAEELASPTGCAPSQ